MNMETFQLIEFDYGSHFEVFLFNVELIESQDDFDPLDWVVDRSAIVRWGDTVLIDSPTPLDDVWKAQ